MESAADEDTELTSEELAYLHAREDAANRIQRVVRGHASRRMAVSVPIWAQNPCPLRGVSGLGYGEVPPLAQILHSYDFKAHIDQLENILSKGLASDLTHEVLVSVWDLVQFAMHLAYAYFTRGLCSPASFLFSSVSKICAMGALRSHRPLNTEERTLLLNLELQGVLATAQQAHAHYQRGDLPSARALLLGCLGSCSRSSSRSIPVLRFILESQRAVLEMAMGHHLEATELLSTLSSSIKHYCRHLSGGGAKAPPPPPRQGVGADRRGLAGPPGVVDPLLDVGFADPKRVCAHLLVLCSHNAAVALRYCGGPGGDAVRAASRAALSLLHCVHPAQPVRRFLVSSYVSSLRPEPAAGVPCYLRTRQVDGSDRARGGWREGAEGEVGEGYPIGMGSTAPGEEGGGVWPRGCTRGASGSGSSRTAAR